MRILLWFSVLNIVAHQCSGIIVCNYKASEVFGAELLLTPPCDYIVYISGYIGSDRTLMYDIKMDDNVSRTFQTFNCAKSNIPIFWGVDLCNQDLFHNGYDLNVYKAAIDKAFADVIFQKYYGLLIKLCNPSGNAEQILLDDIMTHFTDLKTRNAQVGLAVSYLEDDYPFNMSPYQSSLEWIEIGSGRIPSVTLNKVMNIVSPSLNVTHYYGQFSSFGVPPRKYIFGVSTYVLIASPLSSFIVQLPFNAVCNEDLAIARLAEFAFTAQIPLENATFYIAPSSASDIGPLVTSIKNLGMGGVGVNLLDFDDPHNLCGTNAFRFTKLLAEEFRG